MADARVIFYKPLALAASVGGGLLAGAVFGQVWKRLGKAPRNLNRRTCRRAPATCLSRRQCRD